MADVNDPASPTYDPFGLRAGVRYSDADPGRTFAVEPGSGAGFSRAVAASPDLRQWLDDSLSHFGVKETPPNALLSQLLGQPLAPATGDFRYKFAEPLTYRDETNINLAQAVSHGFGTSFVGGLISLNKLQQAAKWEREPGYDVWADPQIKDAGLENQFELFHGSRSSGMTRWLIDRYSQHQRDARVYQDMQGGWLKSGAEMVGGLLGDPTSYLPTTLGVKGASLALKGLNGELTGIEKGLVSLKKPIYGGLADGARAIAVQGAIIVGMNALREGYDPIDRIDQVSNDLFLPAAIAGSLGLLIGASGRYSSKLASLAADARKADFLHGTLPAGTRTFGDMTIEGVRFTHPDFVGPVVPAEREAAESILSKADLRGETNQRIEAAKASIRTPNVGDGVLNPGALATDYGKTVKQEFGSRPENAHLVTPEGNLHPGIHPSEQRGFLDDAMPKPLSKEPDLQAHLKPDAEVDATGRPYTVDGYEHRGERVLAVDGFGPGGRSLVAKDLPIGTTALDYNGVEWKIGQRGDEALWEVVSTNPKPRAGPKRLVDMEFEPGELERADAEPGSVGAALGPGSTLYREDVLMAQGRQAPTGVGLEKLPTDPWARIALGRSVSAMRTMADLVSSGARQTLGNLAGITGLPPVEKMIEQIWNKPMADSVRHTFEQWSAYRKSLATMNTAPDPNSVTLSGRSDFARMREQLGTGIRDLMTRGEKPMSFPEFRDRVGRALNNADEDMVRDGASRYVDAAAGFHRKTYNFARDQMVEHGVFDEAYSKALDHAHEQVRQIKKEADELKARANIERWPPGRERAAEEALMARMEDAEFKFKQQKDALDKLRADGPMLGDTAKSYRPRIADVGEVARREQEFVTRIAGWLHSGEGGGHDLPEAARIAKEIHALYARQNPVFERADAGRLFMSVAAPGSAMARSLTIPDKLIEDFLVNDSEVLMRYHMKQVGAAVEMKKRFGNLDLAEQVAEVEQDYRRQIIAANQNRPTLTDPMAAQRVRERVDSGTASLAEKASIGDLTEEESKAYAKQLTAMMKSDISDLQATRDKIYGTYGAAMDPSRWQSRLIRMAKQYTNLTLLGMSGITQMGDLMRPLMTEGLEAMYGYGFKTLISESRAIIARMTRNELELMGDVSEMVKNVRALSVADTGDFFGNYGKFEHVLNKANQMFFVANGMNAITDMTKNWAATIIMGRVNKLLLDSLGTAAATARLSPELATTADHELAQMIGEAEARIGTRTGARGVAADQAERIKIKAWQDELDAREAAAASRGTAEVPGTALSPADTARFAAANIGPQEAQRIGLMLKIYHEKFGSLHMPNTTAWSDKEAAEIYRSAISQMVNRTVPVPGIGDRPNWMSTEWGSLIGQYKAFSVAAQIRQLQSGLQEGGSQFWYGAASMVGFAVVLNEIRSRLFYDKSTFDRPTTAVIADAVDRSSILGYFSDANRAIEALTGNRMGVKPALGASQPRPINWAQAAGQTLGPAAGQAVRAADVAGDFIAGHPTARTYANARTLTIGGSLPYLDPVMDRAISTGSYHQMAPVAHQLNRLLGVSEPKGKSPQRRAEPALQPAGGG